MSLSGVMLDAEQRKDGTCDGRGPGEGGREDDDEDSVCDALVVLFELV